MGGDEQRILQEKTEDRRENNLFRRKFNEGWKKKMPRGACERAEIQPQMDSEWNTDLDRKEDKNDESQNHEIS